MFKNNYEIKIFKKAIVVFVLLFFSASVIAAAKKWQTETLHDGKTTVNWSISKNNDGFHVVENSAVTTTEVGIEKLIAVLKDVSKHKVFLDDEESKVLKKRSNQEWVIYYFTGAPWPLTPSETISTMVFSENRAAKTASFTITADPDIKWPKKENINRITKHFAVYILKEIKNGVTEISITGKSTAPIKVPEWMINAMFPETPAKILKKLIQLARELE